MRLLLPLVIVALAAGCVQQVPTSGGVDRGGEDVGDVLPFPHPMGHDHDHRDVALHAQSYRMTQTAHHPLAGNALRESGAHALDAKAGHLFAAIYGREADAEGGFFVFDLADPFQPKEVGRYRFVGPMGGDRSLEATVDGNWVVIGTEAIDCAGHINPFGPGLYLIDVRDKTRPLPAAYLPNRGVHSVTIHRIGGEDYVFGLMQGQNIVRIVKEPIPRLEPVGETPIGHDAIVVDDAALGVPLLYAANGRAGFTISDVSDPSKPKQLAEWNIPDRGNRYYIHTGAVQTIDGRRIVVVTSEDFTDYPSAMWVLDATDLSYIETLTSWNAPGDHPAQRMIYSMHNPRFMGSTLLLSYYHAGLWSLDLSRPETPRVQGLFVPGESTGYVPDEPKGAPVSEGIGCPELDWGVAPFTIDVEWWQGAVYVADLPTGLYTLRPEWP